MNFKSILFTEHRQLRSGWRITVYILAFLITAFVSGLLARWIFGALNIRSSEGSAAFLTISGLFSLVPALLVGWLCGKFLEGLPFRALGCAFTTGWAKHLSLGLMVGLLTIGIAVGIAVLYGGLSFRSDESAGASEIFRSLLISLVIFAVAAAFEEALFRGYMFQTLSRAGLSWLAMALTSLFFGIVHLENPGANAVSTANTALAGIWFGLAYLKTRDLWFPFGIHLMWNWAQGSIFGIEVSGLRGVGGPPLLIENDSGPALITGENYGIEAAIPATIAIILSILAIQYLKVLRPDEEMLAMTSSEISKGSSSLDLQRNVDRTG
jgi:membrane protease YdiL (CAAX protease family)